MSITTADRQSAAPLVFQCTSCRAVLSDSQELVCTLTAPGPDAAKCVVVRGAAAAAARFGDALVCLSVPTLLTCQRVHVCIAGMSDARVDRIAHTSVSSTGQRATFFSLCCGSCGAVVGRTYTEAPAGASRIQNLFCLEVSRCTSYELGSSEMRAAAAPQQQQLQLHRSEDNGVGPGVDSPLVLDLLQRLEHLEASLCTVGTSLDYLAAVASPGFEPAAADGSPTPVQLQGIQVLHDAQLRTLPGYQADAQTVG